jgi:DNA-directed RNA polymerase sigma subunit (sigma70/sigma32)
VKDFVAAWTKVMNLDRYDLDAVMPLDAAIQANLRETTMRVLASLTAREERVS